MNCEDFSLSTERASRQTKSSLLLTFHFVVELEDDPNLKVIKLPSVLCSLTRYNIAVYTLQRDAYDCSKSLAMGTQCCP
jgi:hypothetical protein